MVRDVWLGLGLRKGRYLSRWLGGGIIVSQQRHDSNGGGDDQNSEDEENRDKTSIPGLFGGGFRKGRVALCLWRCSGAGEGGGGD